LGIIIYIFTLSALDVEGVFRVSGSAERINELKKAITKNRKT